MVREEAEMHTLSFHRKGTAVGYMYITTIHPEGTGWVWKGHKRAVGSRSGDAGPVVASGDVYAEVAQAEKAADAWFYGIPNIVELTPSTDRVSSSPRPSPAAGATSAATLIEHRIFGSPLPVRGRAVTVREEINKGVNFFGTATFAILASSIFHGLSLPDDRPHKIEDLIFGVIAAAAVGRYLWGKNRYMRSLVPLWFLILALVTKVVGAWVRTGSPIPVGPDLGISFFLSLTAIVFGWQFYATRTQGD
jgi:hypothetical protein